MNIFLCFLLFLVRFLLSLRYKITIKGLEHLSSDRFHPSGGILFLPNHPAEIDPIILEVLLWRRFRPRPLVVEHFYYLKGFKIFMDMVGAMPIPYMETQANKWRAQKVENQFENIAARLKKKNNFLIYPSGGLRKTEGELVGGASFVHRLVQEVPRSTIVLVRTTGLWGSQFSKALTGSSPDFGKAILKGAKILLKNGLFFTPRRSVLVELELPPRHFPYKGSRLEFNRALENWYNLRPDPLTLVSYTFWKKQVPRVILSKIAEQPTKERLVPQKIQKEVFSYVAKLSGRNTDQIERSMHLSYDLGLDSLDISQIYAFLDEGYEVRNLQLGELQTVEDVLQCAVGRRSQQEKKEGRLGKKKFVWPKEKRSLPQISPGDTIQEVFLQSVSRHRGQIATVDALSGALSYSKLKLASLILAKKFRKIPEKSVGVMLPSSSGAYLTILGILLSGKVPVMINWTAGAKAINHCMKLAGIKTVITSDKFLDRLESDDLGRVEQCLKRLEAIREEITLRDKLHALFLSLLPVQMLLKKLALSNIKSSDPAVILFTSGTESLPKGVPLTHYNLLSNQRDALESADLRANEILYGVLPPFHSFGFSVTGLLPILAGLRICYAPDPTDSHGLARDIGMWKPTLFCCAPSFIKALFRVADPGDLQSLRLIVSGAEKTPRDLFNYVHKHLPRAHLLEGYGITECSPIVTLERLGESHMGVGRAISRVELLIIDEQRKPLAEGKEGEICIAGPSVFEGYLGHPRDPFLTIDGKRWYLSGDRGYLKKGTLVLTGRLKRFVKIGAEMVSLGGLEEDLIHLAKEKQWTGGSNEGPVLAISARQEEADKSIIILFTTFEISKEEINAALKESGYGRIVKVSQVRVLEEIPLTGTGKIHYRLLDEIGQK